MMGTSQDDVIERLSAVIEEWNSEIAHSHVHLAAQIASAQDNLSALLSTTEPALVSSAETAEAEVARFSAQLEEREGRIASLELELEGLAQSKAELEQTWETRIAALEAKLHQERERAAALESELAGMQDAREQLEVVRRANEDAHKTIEALRGQQGVPPAPAAGKPAVPAELEAISVLDEHGHKKRMGEILVEAGVITQEQLEDILNEQVSKPQCRFGTLVVEHGYSNEEVIARILAAQLHLPFVELKDEELDPDIPRIISPQLAELRQCVPLRKEGGRLIVAMSNPMDLIAIEDVELASNCQVDPVVATPKGIQFTIARYCYRPPGS